MTRKSTRKPARGGAARRQPKSGIRWIDNPVPWPNGARCAVAITFDIDTDSFLHLEHPDAAPDMLSSLSWLKYDEVAVPRILDVYRHYGIKQTFFYPAWCMEKYPRLVEMILKDGHEIAAHGYLHEEPNKQSRDREHAWLRRQIAVIEKMTGRRPRGWRAPLYKASRHSPGLLAEEGLIYDASLMGDDVPYLLRTRAGDVVELPSHMAMDDWPHFVHSFDVDYQMPIKSPDEAMNCYWAEFESAWRHGGLWIAVWHPFVSGRLSRCERMARMIEDMQKKGKVWFATMAEIAAHVQACVADKRWTPRIDHMPYYDGRIAELREAAE